MIIQNNLQKFRQLKKLGIRKNPEDPVVYLTGYKSFCVQFVWDTLVFHSPYSATTYKLFNQDPRLDLLPNYKYDTKNPAGFHFLTHASEYSGFFEKIKFPAHDLLAISDTNGATRSFIIPNHGFLVNHIQKWIVFRWNAFIANREFCDPIPSLINFKLYYKGQYQNIYEEFLAIITKESLQNPYRDLTDRNT